MHAHLLRACPPRRCASVRGDLGGHPGSAARGRDHRLQQFKSGIFRGVVRCWYHRRVFCQRSGDLAGYDAAGSHRRARRPPCPRLPSPGPRDPLSKRRWPDFCQRGDRRNFWKRCQRRWHRAGSRAALEDLHKLPPNAVPDINLRGHQADRPDAVTLWLSGHYQADSHRFLTPTRRSATWWPCHPGTPGCLHRRSASPMSRLVAACENLLRPVVVNATP